MQDRKQVVRTRMAPSPTGEYHIGHIRTLLYNWAYAKKHFGKFIIRIEDTDQERKVEGAAKKILKVIKDYGFDWDEGPDKGGPHAPYTQSKRLEKYSKFAKKLVDKGSAYYCFCSKKRLEKIREEQRKRGAAVTKYDGNCRDLLKQDVESNLSKDKKHVIRLKTPKNETISFKDEILGELEFDSNVIDDQVLIKSDGFPTYHLAVVVDDHLMEITHIMRGNDWLSSTPKHILLYKAFEWKVPHIAHLPNLKELGTNKKLSKRFGPVSAEEFLKEGYLPEAIINFLMLLGWNPGKDKEFYSLKEFVEEFSIKDIHKTDLVSFDRKKLTWMNAEYIKKSDAADIADKIYDFYKGKYDKRTIKKTLPLVRDRINTLKEYKTMADFFYKECDVDTSLLGKNYKKHLKLALEVLKTVKNWELGNINDELMSGIKKNSFKVGKFFMDLRIAITGKKVTPPINESIEILGKKETAKRLEKVLKS